MIVDWCLWLVILFNEIQRQIYKELVGKLLMSNPNLVRNHLKEAKLIQLNLISAKTWEKNLS